jgi:formate-dependent nitrite reductase membrane component NrfD
MSGERYYSPVHSATQQRAEPDGRGWVREVPEEEFRSYYGRPVLKEPTWTWEIPWYFFFGGLAGASSVLSLSARIAGNNALARRALLVSLGGATVSPVLLIMDLGRPERFYNMLRVVKPTSPMSLGTWVLSAFSTSTGAAVASDLLGVFPRVQRALEVASALLGPALSTYTAVLITDTSVPVWHEARRELPVVFAASAGAAAAMLTSARNATPARRLAVGGHWRSWGRRR